MMKILIVDDEPVTVELLQTFLRMKGFECISAYSGYEAISLAIIDKPQIVLLDLMLPDLEGDEICRRLRANEETTHLPILVISASSSQYDQDRVFKAGANGYMFKPIRFSDLLDRVNRLLPSSAVR